MKITDKISHKASQELIGLFFEDINYAADGGLYAEMIENRSFEAVDAFGLPGRYYCVDDFGYGWSAYSGNPSVLPELKYVSGKPLSDSNPHYLRIRCSEKMQGFSNKAYDGISLKKGLHYKVSFFARSVDYNGENFTVKIEKDRKTYAELSVKAVKALPYLPFSDLTVEMKMNDPEAQKNIDSIKKLQEDHQGEFCRQDDWIKYSLEFEAEESVSGALFSIILDGTGVVEFDFVSMFPSDAVCGIFRKDLFDALKALRPSFIRFPGGCIVEGIGLANRYRWKNTVGDPIDRKYIPNLWAFEDDRQKNDSGLDHQRSESHYGQSFGIGFFEYFLLSEKLGAKPLPVINIGAACQFRSTEIVDTDDKEFRKYIEDALDLIEFANGSPDTAWGSLRCSMGHEAAFDLDMIAIGNEQWESKFLDMQKRYELFEKAIHEKYPEIRLIGTAGPMVETPLTDQAWDFYHSLSGSDNNFCYAVDEHYYVNPEWMYEHTDIYDSYDRNCGVFAGEYAAHTKNRSNDIESALAEAALLTGIERNSDVVKLASYAPLFNRIGYSQWKPDMIWFDSEKVYLTPNYHIQKLFSEKAAREIIDLDGQERELRNNNIYISASKNKEETILKIVNANSEAYSLTLCNNSGDELTANANILCLKGSGKHYNNDASLPEIADISEERISINGKVELPAKSFSIISY